MIEHAIRSGASTNVMLCRCQHSPYIQDASAASATSAVVFSSTIVAATLLLRVCMLVHLDRASLRPLTRFNKVQQPSLYQSTIASNVSDAFVSCCIPRTNRMNACRFSSHVNTALPLLAAALPLHVAALPLLVAHSRGNAASRRMFTRHCRFSPRHCRFTSRHCRFTSRHCRFWSHIRAAMPLLVACLSGIAAIGHLINVAASCRRFWLQRASQSAFGVHDGNW